MGHNEALPLQELAAQRFTAGLPGTDIQVWGNTSPDVNALASAVATTDAAHGQARTAQTDAGHDDGSPPGDIYQRIGHLTRTLHDALHALGYQESLADARDNLPDARERLAYIARLTGDAAEKVLNNVDRARAVQESISECSRGLRTRWETVNAYSAKGARATPAGVQLIEETCAFLAALVDHTGETNGILTEIMMAQDFHDLTGQVIRRVVDLAQELEEQLVKLLIDATPDEVKKKVDPAAFEGPVVNPQSRGDVVADQAGVDDLLASLGF